jgi:integrase
MPKSLTDIAIRNLKPGAVRREIRDPHARGLYVIVQPSGVKSFAVRYRQGGKPRKLTLTSGISLSAARVAAARALNEVEEGRDPVEARKATKAKAADARHDTVRAICEEYLKREGGKLRTVSDRKKAFEKHVFPEIGSERIDSLKRSRIVRLLDKIEDKHGGRLADLTLAYLRKVFNWHATRSDEFRTPIVKGMARHQVEARARVLDDDELRKVWKAANEAGPFPTFIKFCLLTAARKGEVAGLKRAEVKDGIWSLPPERNKTKLPLVRPLSAAAQAVLAAQPKIGDGEHYFTFDGKRPVTGFGRLKRSFDEACGVSGWRIHDVRRTARTLLSRAGVNADIAERALGHVAPAIQRNYDQHKFLEEMKLAYEALATLIERIVNPPEGNVTTLRKKRA